MKTATIKLRSTNAVTFGKFHNSEKLARENAEDYELRTWKEKAHFDSNGNVVIPGFMIAGSIRESAKYLSLQIPGKGKATYTKHFDAGISITDKIVLKLKRDEMQYQGVHVPTDGRAGGSSRVIKLFPIITEWEGSYKVNIGDDIITPDVFEKVIRNAGALIGIGTWRPRNRGAHGTFEVVDIKWNANGV